MKTSLKFAGRVWAYYLITALLCLLFASGLDNVLWQSIINIALLLGMFSLCLNEGGYRGEKACTLAATLEKQIKDGRSVDPEQQSQVFRRSVAVKMLVIAMIPFLLVATANLIVNPPRPGVPAIEPQREEESAITEVQPIGQPEQQPVEPLTAADGLLAFTRFLFMPYVFTYSFLSEVALHWLFLLYGLPFPLMAAIGYLMGPRLRQKKLKDMMKGKRRKMRNLKVNKPPKKPKAEV